MKTKNKILLAAIVALPIVGLTLAATTSPKHKTAKPESPKDSKLIARGKYLASFGDCMACHTPWKMGANGPEPDMARMFSGHPKETKLPPPDLKPGPWDAATAGMTAWAGPWGISYAANITPDTNTGIGIWTEEMFINAMRTGKHMGAGRPILPPMPWQASANLTDDDLKALFAFLRSVPPIVNHVPEPLNPDGKPMFQD